MPGLKRTSTEMTPGGAASKKKKSRIQSQNVTLGRITGRVAPSATTLSLCPGPFSGKKFVTFLYENALTQIGGAANVITFTSKPNDMYDFDNSGDAGNKQPLYFDSLLTASGPYRTYKVYSWKTTYTFINGTQCPVDIFVSPPISSTGEMDSLAEADNFPGVKRLHLTAATGSKTIGKISIKGHIKDVYPTISEDANFYGSYNTSPTFLVYQNVLVRASDGTSGAIVYVSVKHEAYTELGVVDALVS